MIRILSKFILNKIIGWKVIGYLPTDEKYVIAVVPHSSYFDLIIAVLIRTYSGLKIKFIGKKELFNPITSFLFKYLGGIPVDRTKKLNIVDEIVDLFKSGKIKNKMPTIINVSAIGIINFTRPFCLLDRIKFVIK